MHCNGYVSTINFHVHEDKEACPCNPEKSTHDYPSDQATTRTSLKYTPVGMMLFFLQTESHKNDSYPKLIGNDRWEDLIRTHSAYYFKTK
jgi:hypothetical protein